MIVAALLFAATLSADEAPRLVTVALAPAGQEPSITPTQVIGALSNVVLGARVYSPEQLGLDVAALRACPAERRMSCLVGTVCPLGSCPADLLALVLVPARGDSAGISAWWLTLPEAARLERAELPVDEKESRLFELTARLEAGAELGPFVTTLAAKLSEHIRERGLDRRGTIRLLAPAGLLVAVEGRSLGLTGSSTEISDLRPGRRRLTVGPLELEVEVKVESTVESMVELDPSSLVVTHPWRPLVAPAGWSALALGAAALTWAILASASAPDEACLRRSGETSCSGSWVTTGAHALDGPTLTPSEVDSGGLALAPFGLGLSLVGSTWLLLGELSDPSTAPWLDLALGLGAGALAFTAASLALPGDP